MQLPQGIDREGRAATIEFERATLQARVGRDRELAQLQPDLRARILGTSLCGGEKTGIEDDAVEPELAAASDAQSRCARCGGLNVRRGSLRPAQATSDVAVALDHVLVVQSSRTPMGPRACSFCVELPISAPMPNSPPSVNRVDALT